ncbi:hypothetical protein ABZ905_08925 [Streptomyces parvus]|uniref:hypothetical protein n=1 Tax=Streptomyces parvus TaxID=66428 RepID=UPI0033D62A08
MARYSHRCERCDTSSSPADYADALAAQEYHRDQVHGGHVPRQGDRLVLHRTGWADATPADRYLMIAGAVLIVLVVLAQL